MTNINEKLDAEEKELQDLIEWELASMTYSSLQEYYYTDMWDFYQDNPLELINMLAYKNKLKDTEIDLDGYRKETSSKPYYNPNTITWDRTTWYVTRKNNKPIDVSWDISKAPIEFKNPKLDIGD